MKYLHYLFILFPLLALSQQIKPIDTADFAKREKLIENFTLDFENFNQKINKEYNGRIKREIKTIYEFSQEEFIKSIQNKEFILDDRFTEYISTLETKIKLQDKKNELSDFKILISKSNSPNAFCMPGGILVLNIGLFHFFDTEEQLLSVLCHELGHKQLKHPENTILSKATFNNSETLKLRVRSIEKKKTGQNDEAFALLKKILYSTGEKRRAEEQAADSLGYLLYKKIASENESFLDALYYLKDYDSIPTISITNENYQALFDIPEQKFKNEWLQVEDFSKYNYDFYKEKIDKDSLKTHPEMEARILKLKTDFSALNKPPDSILKIDTTSQFYRLKTLAKQEVISNYIEKGEYGKGIYVTIARLLEAPKNTYLKELLGQNFLLLYEAKKQYTFNKYVEYVTPEMEDESYILFLSFLWNLRLEELKTISDYYLQS